MLLGVRCSWGLGVGARCSWSKYAVSSTLLSCGTKGGGCSCILSHLGLGVRVGVRVRGLCSGSGWGQTDAISKEISALLG